MNSQAYTIEDIYKEYGKKEWEGTNKAQQKELINDFINRRLAVIESEYIGLQNKPDIAKKLYDRKQLALINITYEELVAKPLISKALLIKTKQNIIEERLLHHILISYNTARIQTPPERNKEEALTLAQKISNELNNLKNNLKDTFAEYAIKYSEDPTVFQNEGQLDWITWGRTVPSFQNTAFTLEEGEFSLPTLTDFGYHIIYCEKIRPSEYSALNNEELENIVYSISRNTITNQLKSEAAKYDSLQFIKYNMYYNENVLEIILEKITEQINKNKISGQYKLDLISLFEETPKMSMIATFDNKMYGVKWFAERLRMIPSGRHPQINDLESLKQALNIIVLQYLAIQEGVENNVHNSSLYTQQINQIEQTLLYDQYLKWMVNNASNPDSTDIVKYYENNKNKKYLEDKKVSVREIKVLKKNIADSLFLELKYGADFNQIAAKYSKTNPNNGGLIPPFEEGKYNKMGQIAFQLQPGNISEVIKNLDRSYSIIRVEELIDPEYIPLNKMYNRIESILKRENQRLAKELGLKSLHKKYNVIINEEVF